MLYYLGKGTELKKEECKEYKKLNNALAAAEKDETLTVWNENGEVVGGLTNVGVVIVSEMNGNVSEDTENGGEEDKEESILSESENGEYGTNTEAETKEDDGGQQDRVIIPQGSKKVTVVCDGALNLRRSPEWGNENICGRAVKGQTYYIEDIRVVDGKKMIKTIDGIFMSAAPEHVHFS